MRLRGRQATGVLNGRSLSLSASGPQKGRRGSAEAQGLGPAEAEPLGDDDRKTQGRELVVPCPGRASVEPTAARRALGGHTGAPPSISRVFAGTWFRCSSVPGNLAFTTISIGRRPRRSGSLIDMARPRGSGGRRRASASTPCHGNCFPRFLGDNDDQKGKGEKHKKLVCRLFPGVFR
jgi:hypothetical protein